MSLKKGFLKERFSFKGSRFVFFTGFFLSLLLSISFFQFTSLFRELFRILGFLQDGEYLLPFSESDRIFYNFIFAAISCIVGTSFFFEFYFNRPSIRVGKSIRKRISIVTDQRSLTWFFIRWATRLGTMYGIFFAWAFTDVSVARLHPDYDIYFMLAIVVLYLSLWTNFRLVYSKSFKIMFIGFGIFLLASFLISRVNFVNYQKLENSLLKNTVHYSLSVDLPSFTKSKVLAQKSLCFPVFLGYPKSGNKDPKMMIKCYPYEGRFIAKNELFEALNLFKSSVPEFESYAIQVAIYCDRKIPMKIVDDLKHELRMRDINSIIYMNASPSNPLNSHEGIPRFLGSYCAEVLEMYNLPKEFARPCKVDKAEIEKTKMLELKIEPSQIRINGFPIESSELKEAIKDFFTINKSVGAVLLYTDSKVLYEEYISVYDQILSGVDELRKERAVSMGFEYLDVDRWDSNFEKELQIRKMYPAYILELTQEEQIYFFHGVDH